MGGIFSGRRPKRAFDYSCLVAAMFELSTRRVFFYDAMLEVFVSSTDAATAIVQFFARQLKIGPVGVCRIEDNNGIRMLEGELNSTAKRLGVPLQIMWDPAENKENSKNIAIAMLLGAMKKGQAQISNTIPYKDEIYKMFENWSPNPALRRKDDGPDCMAQILKGFSEQIFPNAVGFMQSSGNEHTFAPEVPMEIDPHAGERENADIACLQSMTVAHAG